MKVLLLLLLQSAILVPFCECTLAASLLYFFNFDDPLNPLSDMGPSKLAINCTGVLCPTFSANGQFNGSIFLDQDFFTIPASESNRIDRFTISVWVNLAENVPNGKIVTKPYRTTGWAFPFAQWSLTYSPTNLVGAFLGNDQAIFGLDSTKIQPLQTWHHYVTTWDGQVIKIFVNGKLDASNNGRHINTFTENTDLCVGCRSRYDVGECIIGRLDDLAIWGRPLTDEEAISLYKISLTETLRGLAQNAASESPEQSNTGLIIGAIAGVLVVAFVAMAVFAFIWMRRRKVKRIENLDVKDKTFYSSIALQDRNNQYVDILPELLPFLIPSNSIRIDQQPIGVGASGIVYRAIWRGDTVVAVKQLKTVNPQELMKFQEECRVMKEIYPHPNVVQLLGLLQNPLSLVTEFCSFGSLDSYLGSQHSIDVQQSTQIMLDVARGMMHLQDHKIVHRDLAARNCLLAEGYITKVSDFGMSRFTVDGASKFTSAAVGPLKWMAPELFTNNKYSFQTDIYSFGVLFIEVLTREIPYPDIPIEQFAINVLSSDLTSRLPSYIPRTTPPAIRDIIMKCLVRDPARRPTFGSITGFLENQMKWNRY